MISRKLASESGIKISDTNNVWNNSEHIKKQLQSLIPGSIDSDGILNTKAISHAIGLSNIDLPGCELTFPGKDLIIHKADQPLKKEIHIEKNKVKILIIRTT